MHAICFAADYEHEAKAGCVSEDDAEKSTQGNKAAAIHRAAVAEREECVQSDEDNGEDDEAQVVVDIRRDSIEQSLETEDMDCHVFSVFGPFICHIVHLLLPAQVRLFFNLRVAIVLDDIGVLNSIGRLHLVPSNGLAS